ncbi:MAG: hypothetical protein ACC652_06945 [Acidimicrobiales bacterium]
MVAVRVAEFYEPNEMSKAPALTLVPALARRQRLVDSANDFGAGELQMQRRRLGALVLLLVMSVLLLWAVSGLASGSSAYVMPAADLPAVHTVEAGETLWGIMRDRYPNSDIRPKVDLLAARLGGANLDVGQVIVFDDVLASD